MSIIEKNIGYFTLMGDDTLSKIYFEINGLQVEDFSGSVLYLGWGFNFLPRVMSSNVSKTTIVENDNEVIEWNTVRNNQQEGWTIVNEDAYLFETSEKFDTIVIDLWFDQIEQSEVQVLIDKYTNMLTQNGKILYLPLIIKDSNI